jgi:hypothetical protein
LPCNFLATTLRLLSATLSVAPTTTPPAAVAGLDLAALTALAALAALVALIASSRLGMLLVLALGPSRARHLIGHAIESSSRGGDCADRRYELTDARLARIESDSRCRSWLAAAPGEAWARENRGRAVRDRIHDISRLCRIAPVDECRGGRRRGSVVIARLVSLPTPVPVHFSMNR